MDAKKQKTILEDLLDKYPDIPMDEDGTPFWVTCPSDLGIGDNKGCSKMRCSACWNRPLPEK